LTKLADSSRFGVLRRRTMLGHDLLLESRNDGRGESLALLLPLNNPVGVGLLIRVGRLVLGVVERDFETRSDLLAADLESSLSRFRRALDGLTSVACGGTNGAFDVAEGLAGVSASVGTVTLLLIGIPLVLLLLHLLRLPRLELSATFRRFELIDVDTEVLPHEADAHGVGETADLVRLPAHRRVDHVGVADDAGELRVAITTLRALVDVGGTDDGNAVVDNHSLGVNVGLQTEKVSPERGDSERDRRRTDSVVRAPEESLPQARRPKKAMYSSGSIPSRRRRAKIEWSPRQIEAY
jgi:hypothetical protein